MKNYEHIISALRSWLQAGHRGLQQAVEKTVADGLFRLNDIQHQLSVLRENMEAGQVETWINNSGLSPQNNAAGNNVLCLHAGNLPLVGFQTALAVLLSGANYYGKLSRKDPYLLASFLDEVKNTGHQQSITYTVDLTEFTNLNADMVVFAGSADSIPVVKSEIARMKAARDDAKYITRKAKFSLAYLEDLDSHSLQNLAEAALRYGGNGCRSVAIVVSPFPFEQAKDELYAKMKEFLKANPVHHQPKASLFYQHAYNIAVERPHIWLGDFIVQQSEAIPETDFTLNWITGGEEKVRELKTVCGDMLQSIFTTGNTTLLGLQTEELRTAQRPPLWWKPDGMDVISELISN